jgi:hypothetical protein
MGEINTALRYTLEGDNQGSLSDCLSHCFQILLSSKPPYRRYEAGEIGKSSRPGHRALFLVNYTQLGGSSGDQVI